MAIVSSGATIVASNSGTIMPVNNVGSTYQNLSNSLTFALKNASSGFSMPVNGRIRYQGLLPVSCIVSARYSLASISSGNVLGIGVYKNGSQLADSLRIDPISPEVVNFQASLSNNDYIEVWANSLATLQPAELIECAMSIFTMALI